MNSKLLEILKQLYTTAVQDAVGVIAGRKGYRMRFDEVPEQMEKAIRQAVGEEMLELVGEDDPFEQYLTSSKKSVGRQLKNKNRNDFRAELRQKIKQWQGGEDA